MHGGQVGTRRTFRRAEENSDYCHNRDKHPKLDDAQESNRSVSMCGICGVVTVSTEMAPDRGLIERMRDVIAIAGLMPQACISAREWD